MQKKVGFTNYIAVTVTAKDIQNVELNANETIEMIDNWLKMSG